MKRFAYLGVFVVGLALVLVAGCSSLDKQSVSEQLLALPGNESLAPHLETHALPLNFPGVDEVVELKVLRMPRPGAPRLLLIHGTPGTLLNWSESLRGSEDFEGLEAFFDVTALELAGHGMSRDDLQPETFQECADFLSAAADALDIEPSIVVGHSYGGEVAWRFALDRPELVEALVLISSSGYTRADDEWLPEEQAMRDLPGAGLGWLLNARDRVDHALAPHFRGKPPADFSEETFLVCENSVNWRTMVNLARDENGLRSGELKNLTMPTLLLWGEDDVAYPIERFAQRFATDIPDSELIVAEACGHYLPQERPDEFVRLLREFSLAP